MAYGQLDINLNARLICDRQTPFLDSGLTIQGSLVAHASAAIGRLLSFTRR
jgi:hypothetical protein